MKAFTLSLYIGYAIYLVFPFTQNILGVGGTLLMRTILSILIYAVFVFVSYFIVKNIVTTTGRGRSGPIIVQGILLICFLLAVGYYSFAITRIYNFPPIVSMIFDPTRYFFYWFIAPIIVLFFLER